jgi:hypothetical protein
LASTRLTSIRAAVPAAKGQVEQAKNEVKVAEKSRDQVALGTAQGRVKSAESVKDVWSGWSPSPTRTAAWPVRGPGPRS